jgi:hypothetical protein
VQIFIRQCQVPFFFKKTEPYSFHEDYICDNASTLSRPSTSLDLHPELYGILLRFLIIVVVDFLNYV